MDRRRRPTRRIRRRAKQKIVLAGGLILAAAFVILLAGYLYLRAAVGKVAKDIICDNIYIEDVDVSGMNETQAKAALEERLAMYEETTVELTAEEVTEEVLLGDLGIQIKNADKLVEKAVSYGKTGTILSRYRKMKKLKNEAKVFHVTFQVDEEAVEKAIAEKIPHLQNEAKNATITRQNGSFVITDEEKGVAIEVSESVKAIETYLNDTWEKEGGAIALVTAVEEPEVTRAQLETIQDVLGTYTTNCGTGGGRVQNIQTGASHINGTLLMPGEEYSANAAMEPYTAENGYAEAGSYENGKVVQSMGGGICQVSSTLYNAIILAELEIVERAPHSMLVSYVKPSMDAAIAGDYKDLKFKNNQETPVYIEGYVSGGYITFTVYGKETRASNRTIEYVSEVLSTTPAGEEFVASSDVIGTISKASSGYTGTKAKLWKVVYEDGVEVSRKVMNNSTYNASAAVYNVGTASSSAEATALVTQAIASQNRETIEAAIAQAKQIEQQAAAGTSGTGTSGTGTSGTEASSSSETAQ